MLQTLLMFYLLAIPFMRAPTLPLFAEKIQYSDIIFIPLFFMGAVTLIKKRSLRLEKDELILFVMAGVFFISVLLNSPQIHEFIEFSGSLYLVLMYVLVRRLIDTKRKWRAIVTLWSIVAITISAVGLIGYLWALSTGKPNFLIEYYMNKDKIPLLTYRIKSSFALGAMLASYLHASMFSIMMWIDLSRQEGKSTKWKWLGLAICLACSIFTFGRVLAGISFSVFCILVFTRGGKILNMFRYLSLLACLTYIGLTIVTTVWWIFPVTITPVASGESRISASFNPAHTVYYQLDVAALKMAQAHPLIGVGMGNFNRRSIEYTDWEKAKASYQGFREGLFDYYYKKGMLDPHSTYFGWAAETGLVGLVCILAFFGARVVRHLGALRKSPQGRPGNYMNACAVIIIIGFLLNGFHIDILTMRHFWFMLALGAAGERLFMQENS